MAERPRAKVPAKMPAPSRPAPRAIFDVKTRLPDLLRCARPDNHGRNDRSDLCCNDSREWGGAWALLSVSLGVRVSSGLASCRDKAVDLIRCGGKRGHQAH